ncbi:MAG TPA: PaaI family thioesterase [Burkholderiaceae bacterium]|nr:PaaI family thioesterase [Burkholderiaceae bacterium]
MSHFGEVLGMRLTERADGRAQFTLELRPELCNVHGSVHGGVVMAVLDAVGLWALPSEPGRMTDAPRAATAAFNCNFLRAARRDQSQALRATGTLVKRGRTTYFATAELHSEPDGQLLATGQGVYTLIDAAR